MIGGGGRLRSALVISWQGISAHKLRTLLSMISLFLGVLAVVAVQTGATIADKALVSGAERTAGVDGTRIASVPDSRSSRPILERANREDGARFAATMGRDATIGETGVVAVNDGGGSFADNRGGSYGPGSAYDCDSTGCREIPVSERPPAGAAIDARVVSVSGPLLTYRPFQMLAGHWLDMDSMPLLAPRVVVNKDAALGFARHRVPAQMRFPGMDKAVRIQVIGVVDDGRDQPTAYSRADELANWVPERPDDGLTVHLPAESSAAEALMMSRLRATGAKAEELTTQPVNARKEMEGQLRLMRLIFLSMAALVLFIGVAGVLNVGLATVGERVDEFALRRAVGTPRGLLAGIVLAESLIIGLFTAGLAIGVGAGGLAVVGVFAGHYEPALVGLTFPWEGGLAGVIAGLTAGLLGGLVPALRAARIPISTVMRA